MMVDGSAAIRACAVVVSYHPDVHMLRKVFKALSSQVSAILLVDNTPQENPEINDVAREFCAKKLSLGNNHGIAHGHNCGIRWARERDFSHVLLMDQDSVPDPAMVARLLAAEAALLGQGERVGAVGPVYHDPRVGKSWPFYRMSALGVRGHACNGRDIVPCDFLISSGTLARMSVLDEVGGMNEGYFLEHVDTEWSLRSRSRGYRLFGVCGARMLHSLGNDAVPVPFSARRVQVYQPYRHYYFFRNSVLLWRERHAALPWKLNEVQRLVKRLVFFPLLVAPRLERLRYMLLGLWHGMRGRTGPLQP